MIEMWIYWFIPCQKLFPLIIFVSTLFLSGYHVSIIRCKNGSSIPEPDIKAVCFIKKIKIFDKIKLTMKPKNITDVVLLIKFPLLHELIGLIIYFNFVRQHTHKFLPEIS